MRYPSTDSMPTATRLSRRLVLLMAVATGLAVANLYYTQPLLPAIADDLGLPGATAGLIVTVLQLGYAAGLVFLLPLGDLLERRRLIVGLGVAVAAALAWFGAAPSGGVLLPAAIAVGALSVQAQLLVPLAATLASEEERGRVVGTVMSGLLFGVLLARTVAGWLAETGSWRIVFFVAGAAMLVQAAVLARRLPPSRADTQLSYGQLLRSVPTIIRAEPVLRLRALYGGLAFGGFSVFWTSVAFLLHGPPYGYGSGTIGLFGLAGAAGALTAGLAGRLADRGHTAATTMVATVLLAVSWIPLALGAHSVAWLLVGIVVFDMAVQALHISNQSEIYRLAPEARSRINSAYMTAYFSGGAIGSAASAAAWDAGGWSAVCVVGAGFGVAGVLVWAISRARAARPRSPRGR
jgi:predicted MFS family arabinose efflux permease